MLNRTIDAVLNRVAVDSCILICINLLGLLSFGTVQESGDTNAGTMYALVIIPLIPLIIMSVGMIELAKGYCNFSHRGSSLVPLCLVIFGIWLDQKTSIIFIAAICLVVLYSLFKPLLKVLLK